MKTSSIDIFIFAGSLGWILAEKRSFMSDLFPYRQPCDTILDPSCACNPSILTGKMPREHGHFSYFIYDREKRSPFPWARTLGWLPGAITGNRRMRKRVSRWTARANDFTGCFQLHNVPFARLPWLDYTQKNDICEPGGILGGQPVIFDHWKKSGAPWMRSDWHCDDATNVASLKAALAPGKVRLACLFIAGLDAIMHAHTTESAATDAAFARFEKGLREIHAIASERYSEIRLHLFGDHGMTDTREVTRMMRDFDSLALRYGRDYAAVWDSTMARFWFPGGDPVRSQVTGWLGARTEGRILTGEELRKWGCDFPDGRHGELIYLLNNGIIFAPCYMNQGRVPAMHGFDPGEPGSAACWLTNYPCPDSPKRIEGIFDVMLRASKDL